MAVPLDCGTITTHVAKLTVTTPRCPSSRQTALTRAAEAMTTDDTARHVTRQHVMHRGLKRDWTTLDPPLAVWTPGVDDEENVETAKTPCGIPPFVIVTLLVRYGTGRAATSAWRGRAMERSGR